MKYINIDGNRVRNLRLTLNYTQEELAQQIGISKQAISKLESKKTFAKIQDTNLQPLANALGCSCEYLRGETDNCTEFKDENGHWLRKGFFKTRSTRPRDSKYDSLPLETQMLITDIENILVDLNDKELSFIKKICKLIQNESCTQNINS